MSGFSQFQPPLPEEAVDLTGFTFAEQFGLGTLTAFTGASNVNGAEIALCGIISCSTAGTAVQLAQIRKSASNNKILVGYESNVITKKIKIPAGESLTLTGPSPSVGAYCFYKLL